MYRFDSRRASALLLSILSIAGAIAAERQSTVVPTSRRLQPERWRRRKVNSHASDEYVFEEDRVNAELFNRVIWQGIMNMSYPARDF